MKPSRSMGQLAVLFLSFSSVASAWPTWPRWLPDIDSLVVRQDSSSSTQAQQPSQTLTTTGAKQTNLNTGRTGTDTAATTTAPPSKASGKGNSTTSRTTYNAEDGNGGVTMITPAMTAGSQYYKVSDTITWCWNYTSLQGTPTAVDVLISCSEATRTWTLTQNMTFATSQAFTWDSGNTHKETPLVVEEYTLLIHDSDSAATGVVDAGYLAPFAGFTFGVYTREAYTPMASGWQCVSCSGAISDMIDKKALGFALTISAVTVATFTWFVTGFGIIL